MARLKQGYWMDLIKSPTDGYILTNGSTNSTQLPNAPLFVINPDLREENWTEVYPDNFQGVDANNNPYGLSSGCLAWDDATQQYYGILNRYGGEVIKGTTLKSLAKTGVKVFTEWPSSVVTAAKRLRDGAWVATLNASPNAPGMVVAKISTDNMATWQVLYALPAETTAITTIVGCMERADGSIVLPFREQIASGSAKWRTRMAVSDVNRSTFTINPWVIPGIVTNWTNAPSDAPAGTCEMIGHGATYGDAYPDYNNGINCADDVAVTNTMDILCTGAGQFADKWIDAWGKYALFSAARSADILPFYSAIILGNNLSNLVRHSFSAARPAAEGGRDLNFNTASSTWLDEFKALLAIRSNINPNDTTEIISPFVFFREDGSFYDRVEDLPPLIIPVTGVALEPSSAKIEVGQTLELTTKIEPPNATNKTLSFMSGAEAVATVDDTGKVTGVGAGSAEITATTEDGGVTASSVVNVKTPRKLVLIRKL